MKKTISKSQAEEKIDDFFKNIKSKTPEEMRKIKRLASSYKIPLKEKRKLFCKYCLNPYIKSKIRIKNGKKSIECEHCKKVSRYILKN